MPPPAEPSRSLADEDTDRPEARTESARRGVLGVMVVIAAALGWLKGAPSLDAERLAVIRQQGPMASAVVTVGLMGSGTAQVKASAAGDAGAQAPERASPAGGQDASTGAAGEAARTGEEEPKGPVPAAAGPTAQAQPERSDTVQFHSHRVKSGETVWDIARQYGTDVGSIASANGLYDVSYLKPGQVLSVPDQVGLRHKVERGETLWQISRIYGVSVSRIQQVNGLVEGDVIQPGQLLWLPGVTGPRATQLVVGGRLQRVFSWPATGRISSRFGWRWGRLHEGIDVAVNTGTPVRAAASGRVVYARWGGGYGYLVSVDHGSGVVTRYAHNSRLVVKEGQQVKRGQVISYSGNTGSSTGPHVHFEVRYRGRAVNPLSYLR